LLAVAYSIADQPASRACMHMDATNVAIPRAGWLACREYLPMANADTTA